MPHSTTLMKLTTRCGAAAVDGLNEALLAKAAGAKLLRTTRLRADTTVVPANVSYPTDSSLLAKAVRRIAATGRRVQAVGGGRRTRIRDRSRSAGKRAHEIASKLRLRGAAGRDEAQAVVRRVTGELATLAETTVTDARRLLVNAKIGGYPPVETPDSAIGVDHRPIRDAEGRGHVVPAADERAIGSQLGDTCPGLECPEQEASGFHGSLPDITGPGAAAETNPAFNC